METALQTILRAEMDAQTAEMRGEMNRMVGNMEKRIDAQASSMQLEMAELQSQNQLLLSKISALSSQNSNAPVHTRLIEAAYKLQQTLTK